MVIPIALLLTKKFKHFDEQFFLVKSAIEKVQRRSDHGEEIQNNHWINYYRNEILKFIERVRTHPERVPTKEHYQAVFEHYQAYQSLGGNHYIDLVIEQIEALYAIHYNTAFPPYDKMGKLKE